MVYISSINSINILGLGSGLGICESGFDLENTPYLTNTPCLPTPYLTNTPYVVPNYNMGFLKCVSGRNSLRYATYDVSGYWRRHGLLFIPCKFVQDVSVGVHIFLVVEQSSLESQSRGCAKPPILVVFFTLTDRASTIPSNIRGCQSGTTWSAGQKKIRGTSTKLQ